MTRVNSGSILPLVAFMLTLVIAFIALTADVMRIAHTAIKLQSGVNFAALASYANAVDHAGVFSQANVVNKLNEVSGSGGMAWNQAPAGPDQSQGIFETPIEFNDSDWSFVQNPNDAGELFFRLRARRDGLDSLKLFFVPAIFAFNSWSGLPAPPGADQANPYRVVEVISQPVTRVGEGPPSQTPDTGRNGELKGFAAFPLAISNAQFLQASSPASTTSLYTIDLVSNVTPPPPVQEGHIRGCFVNLYPSGSNLNAYGAGSGATAVSQLISLIEYFQATAPATSHSPWIVERGSMVSAFDHEESSFKQNDATIKARLNLVPQSRYQIIPVLRNDPAIASSANEVVGFARMRLASVTNISNGNFLIRMEIGQSTPVRNATADNTISAVPTLDGSLLPPPTPPFTARNSGLDGQSIDARPRGIALAPSLSPNLVEKIEIQ